VTGRQKDEQTDRENDVLRQHTWRSRYALHHAGKNRRRLDTIVSDIGNVSAGQSNVHLLYMVMDLNS